MTKVTTGRQAIAPDNKYRFNPYLPFDEGDDRKFSDRAYVVTMQTRDKAVNTTPVTKSRASRTKA
ncbi:hypothetical protein [Methylocystis parvus]|uniref:Uncharacterized protein n=1 Tax=Methylocystis parvus TaxID=134 RepID=A0A6B8M101_9HYPH|nr:hypothetical protein [Methylocystis parvus]QGM98527.1 hypothetical protein F7D14_14280 [Methylocystis parvus]WBK01135.1 hypothetical protein MMG94_05290 [Methylocystis parvus OBBP]